MSVTKTDSKTGIMKNKRFRLVRWKSSTTDTSVTLERGIGYQVAIGGYTDYTLSGDTLTLTIVGDTNKYNNVLLLGA